MIRPYRKVEATKCIVGANTKGHGQPRPFLFPSGTPFGSVRAPAAAKGFSLYDWLSSSLCTSSQSFIVSGLLIP
jgi:hypothetical protein